MKQTNLSMKQTDGYGEQIGGSQARGDWGVGVSRCKLSYTEWINNKVSLYSTENYIQFSSLQSLRHVWLFATPWTAAPGLPVHHQLPESTQTHVHWVGDAIQPSHPLSSPSPPALNLSQHRGLFKWVSSSHQVAQVLEFQLQHEPYQWTPRTDLL